MSDHPGSSAGAALLQKFSAGGPGLLAVLEPVVATAAEGRLDDARRLLPPPSPGQPPADRRAQLAFDIALSALARLRVLVPGTAVDLGTQFGVAPSLDDVHVTNDDFRGILQALAAEQRRHAERHWPCPSCGAAGKRVATAPLLRTVQTYGRMFFDLDRLLAPWMARIAATRLQWDTIAAHAMLHGKLQAPVSRCQGCALYYLEWPYEPGKVDAFYAGRETVDLAGTAIFGRGHSPAFVYGKLALPLHVDRVVGGLARRHVYDLGCAEGLMLEACRRLGATVAGCDVDVTKTAYARRILDLVDIDDRADALHRLPPGSVDVLICHHTLEHLVRVGPWLDAMAAAVRPGGHVVLSVPHVAVRPNGEALEMGGDHWIGFDAATLRRHVTEHGLTMVDERVDDGFGLLIDRDPIFGQPTWSGRRIDVTIVARRG